MMTAEDDRDEKALYTNWIRLGDKAARDKIISNALPMIWQQAKYLAQNDNINLQADELFGVGQLGALRWLDRYNIGSTTPPSIYIAEKSKNDMIDHIRSIYGRNIGKRNWISNDDGTSINSAISQDKTTDANYLVECDEISKLRRVFLETRMTDEERIFLENELSDTPLSAEELAVQHRIGSSSIKRRLFPKLKRRISNIAPEWIPETT